MLDLKNILVKLPSQVRQDGQQGSEKSLEGRETPRIPEIRLGERLLISHINKGNLDLKQIFTLWKIQDYTAKLEILSQQDG